ncbi:MAG: hypothetical protein ACN0LA_13990 [Candidatus Longimicrobiales bacterium M2_2A_002]
MAVVVDPEATALAASVVVPGSAWELPGTEGLTVLSAMTVLEAVRPALDSLGARAGVTCGPAAFTFTLLAPGDARAAALETFLDGLFRPAPTQGALQRARVRLARSLALDQASPAWQARLAVRHVLYADSLSSGWLGPACGVPETLAFFDLTDIRAAARRFAPHLAHIAAIVPAGGQTVETMLTDRIPAGPRPRLPAPRAVSGGRRFVERNTVTAWVAVAFPFGPEMDLEAARLVGAVVTDAIGPGVDRPESFTAGHELELHGGGGALVIRAITTPDAAQAYADRIETLVERAARGDVADALYERVARRYRGIRLQQLAAPEARSAAMALALALGRTPRPWPDSEVGPDRLRRAAAALGAPARTVVGPRSARGAAEP